MTSATPFGVCVQLNVRGVGSYAELGGGPTHVRVPLTDGDILLAADFNREDGGWEAVLETPDGEQTPLIDGPGADATADAVAHWAWKLARNWKEHLA